MIKSCALSVSILIAVVTLGAAGGCQSDPTPPTGVGSTTDVLQRLNGEWVLDRVQGESASTLLDAGGRLPNLHFQPDGRVTGFGGVNRLGGSLDAEGLARGEFNIGDVISTKMAGPPRAMELEGRFTRLLGEAERLSFTNGGEGLTLSKDGAALLEFSRSK